VFSRRKIRSVSGRTASIPGYAFAGRTLTNRVDRRPKRQNDVRGRLAGRAEQRRVRRRREVVGLLGQRLAGLLLYRVARIGVDELEVDREGLEDLDRGGCHFLSDSVARNDGDFVSHAQTSTWGRKEGIDTGAGDRISADSRRVAHRLAGSRGYRRAQGTADTGREPDRLGGDRAALEQDEADRDQPEATDRQDADFLAEQEDTRDRRHDRDQVADQRRLERTVFLEDGEVDHERDGGREHPEVEQGTDRDGTEHVGTGKLAGTQTDGV